MKTVLISALLALSIFTPSRPQCSEVQSATPVLDGRYAGVTCPEGRVTVAMRPNTPLPALGRSSVALVRSQGHSRYFLRASDGRSYEVTR